MKNITFKLSIGLIIIFILIGCENKTRNIYTKINDDGSIYREFVESADSAFMVGDTSKSFPFLVRLDSTWNITYSYGHDSMPSNFISGWPLKEFTHKIDSVHHLKVKMSKKFNNVNEIASTFKFDLLPWHLKINQDFKLHKKFRWFYTYYEYTEIFKKLNPNPQTKISDFLTEEEISHYFGENADYTKGLTGIEALNYLQNLEGSVERWISKCYYDAYYNILLQNLNTLHVLKIDTFKFRSMEHFLFDSLYYKKEFVEDSLFFVALDKYFHTDVFVNKIRINDSIRSNFEGASNLIAANLSFEGDLNYNLSMPGKVIETTSVKCFGDTLHWKVNSDRFLFSDYKIYAKSRKPNYWAFAVTGIIVLLGVLGLWVKRK